MARGRVGRSCLIIATALTVAACSRLDIVAANADSNTVSVLLGTGDGSFAAKADYLTGTSPQAVALADLNGDRKLDLVVANADADTVSVLLGTGDGRLAAKTDYAAGDGPLWVALGDLNGDGKLDLAVTNATAETVSVLLGMGDGKLAAPADYPAGADPLSGTLGDLNGDGKPDPDRAGLQRQCGEGDTGQGRRDVRRQGGLRNWHWAERLDRRGRKR